MIDMPYTIDWAAVDAARDSELVAMDLRADLLRRAALRALSEGKSVRLVLDGQPIGVFHPDGTSAYWGGDRFVPIEQT